MQQYASPPKLPRSVLEGGDPTTSVYAFPPNRETLGGTAYFLAQHNILIDAPAWNEENLQFLDNRGGVKQWVMTHRGGFGKQVAKMAQQLGCVLVVQEQEAYLLPEVDCQTFHHNKTLALGCEVIWTPGHSPGSACVYYAGHGGMLFTGRHLLGDRAGNPAPLRIAKTFHWPRQLRSVQCLRDRFSVETLSWICPGASIGMLRGKGAIDRAFVRLGAIDLAALAPQAARLL
ncbi:MAG: MBL fold metallo-hydrolase [Alkalinema sp. RU_4_3]|nr:MBL fold metallo-hydrolase [Alkalinema sp. RU_4_3]